MAQEDCYFGSQNHLGYLCELIDLFEMISPCWHSEVVRGWRWLRCISRGSHFCLSDCKATACMIFGVLWIHQKWHINRNTNERITRNVKLEWILEWLPLPKAQIKFLANMCITSHGVSPMVLWWWVRVSVTLKRATYNVLATSRQWRYVNPRRRVCQTKSMKCHLWLPQCRSSLQTTETYIAWIFFMKGATNEFVNHFFHEMVEYSQRVFVQIVGMPVMIHTSIIVQHITRIVSQHTTLLHMQLLFWTNLSCACHDVLVLLCEWTHQGQW